MPRQPINFIGSLYSNVDFVMLEWKERGEGWFFFADEEKSIPFGNMLYVIVILVTTQ